MSEGLKLILSADGTQVTKTLEQLEQDLRQFREQLKVATDVKGIEGLNNSIAQTTKQIRDFKNTGVGPLAPVMRNNNAVTQQFNQLLRETPNFAIDARIGIMSLSNNLPYFTDAITSARKSGQSFTQILGGLGKSLFSVSNVAILGITALMFFAGRAQQAKKQTEDFVSTLDSLTAANLKGAQAAVEETTKLKVLYEASQNQTIAVKERKKAVDELQRIYPSYFGNISDETILAGGARKAYDELTTSILNAAKARAAMDMITEKEKQKLELEEKQLQTLQQIYDTEQKVKRAQSTAISQTADPRRGEAAAIKAVNLQKDLNALNATYLDQQKEKNKLADDQKKLAAEVEANMVKNGVGFLVKPGDTPTVKIPKVNLDPKEIELIVKGKTLTVDPGPIPIGTVKLPPISTLQKPLGKGEKFLADEKRMQEMQQMAGFLDGSLTPAFEDFFSTVANGGENAFAKLGQAMAQMITQLIASMAAMAAVAGIVSAITGVPFSTTFKGLAAAKGLPFTKNADGGIYTGPAIGLVGEYASAPSDPEIVAPLSKLKGMIGGMGGGNVNVTGELKVRGKDLVLALAQNQKLQGYLG